MEARMRTGDGPADAMTGIGTCTRRCTKVVCRDTLELVHMRASQINGAVRCVNAGMYSPRKRGD